jgi:hypothetical protein
MITLTVITISKLHCCSFSELCFFPVLKSETNVNKTDFHHRCVTAGMLLSHRSNDKQKILQICNLGGLDLSRRGLDRDSRSRRRQRVSLDSRENIDSIKKLVSTIEIETSRFRLDNNVQTKKSRSRSRLFGLTNFTNL